MPEEEPNTELSQNNIGKGLKDQILNRITKNTAKFFKLTADEISVPRSKVIGMASNLRISQSLEVISRHLFSSYPVFSSENQDEIVGIVSIKDILHSNNQDKKLSEVMKPVNYVSYSEPLWQVLHKFQENKIKTAVVVNEYGEADGFISSEDILEELVGNLDDAYDKPEPRLTHAEGNKVIVSGQYELEDLIKEFKLKLEINQPETVSGYISQKLGRIPVVDEELVIDGLKFKILEADFRRIILVTLEIDKSEH